MDKRSELVSPSTELLFGPLAELARHLPCFLYQLKQTPNQQFHYVYASENAEALFGIPAQAIMQDGNLLLDRIHPADAERVYQTSAECAAQLKPWHAELRIIRLDEQIVWLEAFDFPRQLPDGSILFSGFANDISRGKTPN
ncbi:PAS domain-containing protein [Alishewanella longhuensis]